MFIGSWANANVYKKAKHELHTKPSNTEIVNGT